MKQLISAGGVVFTKKDGNLCILIAQHASHHGWVFPKGLVGDHIASESKEHTAIREVQEETGITGKILHTLTPISYSYTDKEDHINKTVYYYVMQFVSGDIRNHDAEMENVEWINSSKVLEKLTFKSDKKVWLEAAKIINQA